MRMTIYRAHEFKRELQLISVRWLGRSEGMRSRLGGDNEVSEAYRQCSSEVGTLITRSILDIPATYPPDTVFSHHQLADALNVTVPALQKAEIPVSYLFGRRSPLYVWREVVQRLRDTSEGGVYRNRKRELSALAESWEREAVSRRPKEPATAETMLEMAAELRLALGEIEPVEVPSHPEAFLDASQRSDDHSE